MSQFCVLSLVLEFDAARKQGLGPEIADYLARCPGDAERAEFTERLGDLDFVMAVARNQAPAAPAGGELMHVPAPEAMPRPATLRLV